MANNQKGKPSNGLPFLNIYNMTQKVIYLKRKVHKMKKYISIDIGGTAIKYGIICENAEIMMKETMKTEAEKGGSAILEKVFVIVEKLQGRIQEKASGICISTAGMVNTEQGAIFYSAPLIPNYTGMQFKKLLEDKNWRYMVMTGERLDNIVGEKELTWLFLLMKVKVNNIMNYK